MAITKTKTDPSALPLPADSPYEDTFAAALDELEEVMSQREELDSKRDALDSRIFKLREAIVGLGGLVSMSETDIIQKWPDLFPDKTSPDVGFTDAIRGIFKAYPDHYHSPVWIRDALKGQGFEIEKYKNVLASIHSILKRMKLKSEIFEGNREGRSVYKLNPKGPLGNQTTDLSDDDIPF